MAMQTTLIQTAAMSVADIGEGPKFFFETGESPYLRVWLTPPPPPPLLSDNLLWSHIQNTV